MKKPGIFKILDEYLPLDKRTVRKGFQGSEERLRRDRIKARRMMKTCNNDDADFNNQDSQKAISEAPHTAKPGPSVKVKLALDKPL